MPSNSWVCTATWCPSANSERAYNTPATCIRSPSTLKTTGGHVTGHASRPAAYETPRSSGPRDPLALWPLRVQPLWRVQGSNFGYVNSAAAFRLTPMDEPKYPEAGAATEMSGYLIAEMNSHCLAFSVHGAMRWQHGCITGSVCLFAFPAILNSEGGDIFSGPFTWKGSYDSAGVVLESSAPTGPHPPSSEFSSEMCFGAASTSPRIHLRDPLL